MCGEEGVGMGICKDGVVGVEMILCACLGKGVVAVRAFGLIDRSGNASLNVWTQLLRHC